MIEDADTVKRAVHEYEVDVVFHLAAQTIVGVANHSPVATFEANVRGTWNLLEACRTAPHVKAVLNASSDKAYGTADALPYTEETPLRGQHPYDVSKSCADLIATSYHNTYGLPVCTTRCGNLFGPGDLNWSRIVPGTIRSLLRGVRPVVRSDGSNLRDYLFVQDAVEGYLVLAEAMLAGAPGVVGEAFNLSLGQPQSVLQIVSRVAAAVGSDIEPDVLNQAVGEIHHQFLSPTKACDVLGWSAGIGLDEGLRRTVDWYRAHVGV
jgi:CDP-glucose 4,6-dehydratase